MTETLTFTLIAIGAIFGLIAAALWLVYMVGIGLLVAVWIGGTLVTNAKRNPYDPPALAAKDYYGFNEQQGAPTDPLDVHDLEDVTNLDVAHDTMGVGDDRPRMTKEEAELADAVAVENEKWEARMKSKSAPVHPEADAAFAGYHVSGPAKEPVVEIDPEPTKPPPPDEEA